MEKMRTHKHNVEKRMQSDNVGDWTYWSQRRDKLKRYPKHESLDPSWYTDNIYSNHSLDLEGDLVPDFVKFDNFLLHSSRHANQNRNSEERDNNSDQCDEDDIFTLHPRSRNLATNQLDPHREYRYPKSRSCCFGGGYEVQKPTQLMPKSSSFSTARASANFAKIREIKNTYDRQHLRNNRLDCCSRNRRGGGNFAERLIYRNDDKMCTSTANDIDREMLENDFCYSRSCDRIERNERCVNHIYHIDTQNRDHIADLAQTRSKSDYIKNEWLDRNKNRNHNSELSDKNGNYCCDDGRNCTCDDSGNSFRSNHRGNCYAEDYLLAPNEMDSSNVYEYSHLYNRRRGSSFETEMDQFISRNNQDDSKMLDEVSKFDSELSAVADGATAIATADDFPFIRPILRNKSLLDAKNTKQYDAISTSSSEIDLDDFNFDFEKYWEDLDKTNSSLNLDMQNNNTYNNLNSNLVKVKNVNLCRYNNGTLIDNRSQRNPTNNDRSHNRYLRRNLHKSNNLVDNLLPTSALNNPQFSIHSAMYPHQINNIGYIDNDFIQGTAAAKTTTGSPFNRLGRKIHPERSIYNNFYDATAPPPQPPPPPPPMTPSTFMQHQEHPHLYNNNALSLINNIFSIYKPKKYSPLNCHSQQMAAKPEICKKMNVPSTIRPLGAPANDFITSLKRPLLVAPSPCVDQPHFKIIPEKTGLKISPLYRFDFDSGENKFKLKSTARPLLFPY